MYTIHGLPLCNICHQYTINIPQSCGRINHHQSTIDIRIRHGVSLRHNLFLFELANWRSNPRTMSGSFGSTLFRTAFWVRHYYSKSVCVCVYIYIYIYIYIISILYIISIYIYMKAGGDSRQSTDMPIHEVSTSNIPVRSNPHRLNLPMIDQLTVVDLSEALSYPSLISQKTISTHQW